MVTKLTEHFTLEELTVSQEADRRGISNLPSLSLMPNLLALATGLEDVRKLTDSPIVVSSGYRSETVNKLLGGSTSSYHMLGLAADMHCPKLTNKQLYDMIYTSDIAYDQLILEYVNPVTGTGGWVHIGFAKRPRKQALVIDTKGTRLYVA